METTELFGRYHRRIRQLASHRADRSVLRAEIAEVMERLNEECRRLSPASSRRLRDELASQLEEEALHCTDASMKAVLVIAVKHLEAEP